MTDLMEEFEVMSTSHPVVSRIAGLPRDIINSMMDTNKINPDVKVIKEMVEDDEIGMTCESINLYRKKDRDSPRVWTSVRENSRRYYHGS